MNKILQMLMSWKTTVIGAVGAAYIIIEQLRNLFDNDPATTFDFNMLWVAGVLTLIGLFAKDGDKSSENVGIK